MPVEENVSITLTINRRKVEAPEGSTILEAARGAGIRIPTLCHHPDLVNVGACRICVVSVRGARGLQTACTTPAVEGMEVDADSDEARETRRFVLEMLLSDHPNECMTCESDGDCELQELAYEYDVPWPTYGGARHAYPIDHDPNPFIVIDRNKCILCGRCVRACAEIQNRDVLSIAHRGFDSCIVAGANQLMLESGCESCGQCTAYCPVGALHDRMSLKLGRANKVSKVRTVCSFCGVGCSFDLNVRENRVVRVTSSNDAPVNGLALCVKGRYGYDYIHHPDRLARPMVRARWLGERDLAAHLADGTWRLLDRDRPQARGADASPAPDDLVETDWDTALDVVAATFARTKAAGGGGALAVLASAKCTNEENFLFSKFARQILGTHSIDHCARL
jgi:predicted molibdopterin-dependent oxidoreductase YjgC